MLSNLSVVMLLAKATIILIAALGITIAMQRASAGARHLVWLVTLGALLLVPALAAWSPLRVAILPPLSAPISATDAVGMSPSLDATTPSAGVLEAPAQYTTPESTSILASVKSLDGIYLVLAIWGAMVLALAVWLGWSALAVRRIVRRAHPLDTQDWMTPLYEIADRLELEEPPRLLGSNDAKMPFACGFFSPAIVLPASCESWSLDRRRAVLLHELAHVKRRDLLGHTLGRLTCAVYWFHPLVWKAAKQLRSESERACDDLALACGAKASDYAEHLLDIVTSVRGDATPAVALAMARRKEFEGRMLAILDPELRHSRPSRRQSAALIGTLAVISLVVGAAAPAPRASIVVTSSVPGSESAAIQPTGREQTRTSESTKTSTWQRIQEKTDSRIFDKANRNEPVPAESAEAQAEARAEARAEAKTEITIEADAVSRLLEGYGVKLERIDAASPDERPALLANILRTDKDPSLRRVAAWGLAEHCGTTTGVEALSQALRRDSDVKVREMAGWALADARKNSVAVTALSEALRSDAAVEVRAISAWSLGNIGDTDAVGPLTAALADAGKGVRARAAWAIGAIEPRQAPPALVALLRDSQPMMRQLAAWALYQIEDPSTAGALNAALQAETNTELKLNYIQALAALGEKSVDAVKPLLLSSDPKIKSMAVRALAGGSAGGPWPWPWPEPRPYP
jgi:beta-lactamase regulating signal transducer with metallopeptidase domain